MAKFRFLDGANEDAQEIHEWYLEQSPVAADGFQAALKNSLQKIIDAPNRWPHCDRRHQHLLLDGFPVSIVYRMESDEVVVAAVAHAKRKPGYWSRRRD